MGATHKSDHSEELVISDTMCNLSQAFQMDTGVNSVDLRMSCTVF